MRRSQHTFGKRPAAHIEEPVSNDMMDRTPEQLQLCYFEREKNPDTST